MTPTTRLRILLALSALLALAACGSAPKKPSTTPRPATSPVTANLHAAAANAVLFRALALVGTPYRYGGNTPETGFDCSGLVGYVFRDAAGVSLPRTSADIAEEGRRKLDAGDLRGGDLVLFAFGGRRITHVGIYVGERRFVHAPNSGGTVRLNSLDDAGWRDSFRYGKRVFE